MKLRDKVESDDVRHYDIRLDTVLGKQYQNNYLCCLLINGMYNNIEYRNILTFN